MSGHLKLAILCEVCGRVIGYELHEVCDAIMCIACYETSRLGQE